MKIRIPLITIVEEIGQAFLDNLKASRTLIRNGVVYTHAKRCQTVLASGSDADLVHTFGEAFVKQAAEAEGFTYTPSTEDEHAAREKRRMEILRRALVQ